MENIMKELEKSVQELGFDELEQISGGDITREYVDKVCNAYAGGMKMAQEHGYSFDQFWDIPFVGKTVSRSHSEHPMEVDHIKKWMKYKWNDVAEGR